MFQIVEENTLKLITKPVILVDHRGILKVGAGAGVLAGMARLANLAANVAVGAPVPEQIEGVPVGLYSTSAQLYQISGSGLPIRLAFLSSAVFGVLAIVLTVPLYLALRDREYAYGVVGSSLLAVSGSLVFVILGAQNAILRMAETFTTVSGEAQRTAIATAADAFLGTSQILDTSVRVLLGLAFLVLSVGMWSGEFNKTISGLGIVAGVLNLAGFLGPLSLGPASLPITLAVSAVGALWFIGVGHQLYNLVD